MLALKLESKDPTFLESKRNAGRTRCPIFNMAGKQFGQRKGRSPTVVLEAGESTDKERAAAEWG